MTNQSEAGMAKVLKPDAFHQKFTIYVNVAGDLVQRTLSEMSADEVMAAVQWQSDESDRLEREAAPFIERTKLVMDGKGLTNDLAQDYLEIAVATMRAAAAAGLKAVHLMEVVRANLPQWKQHPGMTMEIALRRFWPGGRAA